MQANLINSDMFVQSEEDDSPLWDEGEIDSIFDDDTEEDEFDDEDDEDEDDEDEDDTAGADGLWN